MKIRILLVCTLFSLVLSVQGQHSFLDDWKHVQDMFGKEQLQVSINNTLFSDFDKTRVVSEEPSLMQRSGAKLYYKVGNMEIMFNKTFMMVVNHDAQLIMIDKRDDQMLDEYQKNYTNFIQQMSNPDAENKQDIQTTLDGNSRKHTFHLLEGDFERITYLFNIETGKLSEIKYYYRNEQMLENVPSYSRPLLEVKFIINNDINPQLFNISRFGVLSKNKQFSSSIAYTDYDVLNHLEDY
jgi:hypothetical protein